MSSQEEHHPSWLLRLLPVGAIATAVLFVVAGVLVVQNIHHAREISQLRTERARQLNHYLALQCSRDQLRDKIFIQTLRDAQQRAAARIKNRRQRQIAVGHLSNTIYALKFVDRNCISLIPPVLPRK